METVLVFSQKPASNENLVYGSIQEVDIGMPIAYMTVKNTLERYKLSFPWQSRTPHLVECIQECKSFKIECCACEHEIMSLSLVIDVNGFNKEIEENGTVCGEIHIIGLVMDIWRDARIPIINNKYSADMYDISACECWRSTYNLFDHQIESAKWLKTLEQSSPKLDYNGNIMLSDTGWFIDTESECLTTDASVREGSTRGGILANGTGTGKTATILYHIMSNKPSTLDQSVNKYRSKGNLIILPVNLVTQWVSEIEKFCTLNEKKVIKFYQSKDIKNITMNDLLQADIVLTTLHFLRTSKPYSDIIENALGMVNISGKDSRNKTAFSTWSRLGNNNQPIIEAIYWYRVIVDEIHTVFSSPRELRQIKQFTSKFFWGITATPDLFTENAQQLYLVLQREKAHHPNMLKSLIEKCVHKRESYFDWPQTNLNLVNLTAKERIYLQSQEEYLTPTEIIKLCSFVNVSDDVCSGTTETIEKELKQQKYKAIETMKAEVEEYDKGICILEKASSELEDQITNLSESELDCDFIKTQLEVAKTSAERHAQELMKIRESRNIVSSKLERTQRSMDFFTDRLNILQSSNHSCPICHSKKCSVIIPCGHLFCSQCIRKSYKINKTCPECRQPFDISKIRGVTLGEMGTKMLEIVKLIESINDPIILFVQWKSMVRGMKSFLKGMDINVLSLEGNVTQRASTLHTFTFGGVLLLCLEDSFAGLHLPHARHVIFSHAIVGDIRSVKLLEEQAIARCVRHGQTEKVKVYSFVVKDCDEEIIWNNTHDSTNE